ncbi:hypothetical protein ACRQ4B_03120 [Curtobacterium sp. SP.BCo]|uniref:hypothetical protein n=1 Tax=Curtobacterium sp. SP.BCo TaxID=3435229 RepID=UPI003F73F471
MITAPSRARPAVVTVAVAVWLVVFAGEFVATVVRLVRTVPTDGPWLVVPAAIGVGIGAWFAYGAIRVGRGSARARFWMAVLGAVGFVGVLIPPYDLRTVAGLAGAVAAVLPYLPSARPFFPRTGPRPTRRPREQRVVGWDPDTGEPVRATD